MGAETNIKAVETLHQAYVAAFAEIEGATKSANNPHFKSKYADLGAVMDAIKPALAKHGLAFWQLCEPSDDGVVVETVLVHISGEERSLGKLFVPANKKDAQGFGSAQTYARRYSLQTAFGVPAEDDDGNAAARGQSKESAVSPSRPISDSQWALAVQLLENTGTSTEKVCAAHKIGSLKEMTVDQWAALKPILEKRLAQQAEATRETANAG